MIETSTNRPYIDEMSIFRLHPLSLCTFFAVLIAIAFMFLLPPSSHSQNTTILFREDFASLGNWRPLYFPKIPKHTTYTIEANEGNTFLVAQSTGSASALAYKEHFNIYEYPRARWRWKISNIYNNAPPQKKSGDDYPIRVYVVFKYDPETAGVIDRVKYSVARKLYGEYPPHSTLNYVWANDDVQKTIITSPYTDKARLIALQKGGEKAGTWQNEEINILKDYRAAFGADPPPTASLAIMNDSDNTGQSAVSYLDFNEVFKDGQ
jgi:hypothetical protein